MGVEARYDHLFIFGERIVLKILVIGLGNIGRRHLQALSALRESASIYIYDIDALAMDAAEGLFYSTKKENRLLSGVDVNLNRIKELSRLPLGIDVCIIATNSIPRLSILEKVLSNPVGTIKHIVLEKFLFPKWDEYLRASKLFGDSGVSVCVNQWVSGDYFFSRAASWVCSHGCNDFLMEVRGSRWGLECNSVHFIDYFHSIIKRRRIELMGSKILGSRKSKRDGYVEVFGEIHIKDVGGRASLIMKSIDDNSNEGDITISMRSGERKADINLFSDNQIRALFVEGHDIFEESSFLPYQSQTTAGLIHDLVLKGVCDLPSYDLSVLHHQLVFSALSNYFIDCGFPSKSYLPIT